MNVCVDLELVTTLMHGLQHKFAVFFPTQQEPGPHVCMDFSACFLPPLSSHLGHLKQSTAHTLIAQPPHGDLQRMILISRAVAQLK